MLYTEKEKHEIERKNVIYQTRCQEPYSASGTFFCGFFCEFDEKILDNLSLGMTIGAFLSVIKVRQQDFSPVTK